MLCMRVNNVQLPSRMSQIKKYLNFHQFLPDSGVLSLVGEGGGGVISNEEVESFSYRSELSRSEIHAQREHPNQLGPSVKDRV